MITDILIIKEYIMGFNFKGIFDLRIWYKIKHSVKMFLYYGKRLWIDAAFTILGLIGVLYVAFGGDISILWPVIGFPFIYGYSVVIRLGSKSKEAEDLKEKLREHDIPIPGE